MIFTKETFKGFNIINPPTCNELIVMPFDGRINRLMYEVILEHFSRLDLITYVIYVPTSRIHDHYFWEPVRINEYNNNFELNTNSKFNFKLVVDDVNWNPRIIPTQIEGEICNQIWCHAIGVSNIDKYKYEKIPSYEKAKEIFPEGLNWVHVKIG
jgi:hypothetical protein